MKSKVGLITAFFRHNLLLVIATFIASIASSLLNVLIPVSIGRFYELVLHDNSVKGKLFGQLHIPIESVTQFFLFFILIVVAKALITFLEKFFTGITGERFSRDLRQQLFRTQLSQSYGIHQMKPTGKYLLRYSGDLLFIQQFITKGMIRFIGDLIFLVVSVAVLFTINKALTIIMVACISIACIVIVFLNKQVRVATTNRRNQRSTLLGFVANRMYAFLTIKSFNREVPEEYQYNSKSGKLYDYGIDYWKTYSVVQALLPLFIFGTMGVLLYYVHLQRAAFEIHPAGVLDFVLLFLYMQSVIRRILKVNVVWNMGNVSFMKLLRILNLPAERKSETRETSTLKGRISCENISFQYATAAEPLLENLSFAIQPGSIAFIRGRQGAGKSTLLKIILGIYPPRSGKVFIDNDEYDDLAPNTIRRNVTIVSSEVPLLGNTVFKAISYSRAEEKRLRAAEWLRRLNFRVAANDEANLDFHLEDLGKNLSAGQRKQLMFARALLTRKKVLLLDDAFDDLDEETRKLIVECINKQKTKRTIIVTGNSIPPQLEVDQVIDLKTQNVSNKTNNQQTVDQLSAD